MPHSPLHGPRVDKPLSVSPRTPTKPNEPPSSEEAICDGSGLTMVCAELKRLTNVLLELADADRDRRTEHCKLRRENVSLTYELNHLKCSHQPRINTSGITISASDIVEDDSKFASEGISHTEEFRKSCRSSVPTQSMESINEELYEDRRSSLEDHPPPMTANEEPIYPSPLLVAGQGSMERLGSYQRGYSHIEPVVIAPVWKMPYRTGRKKRALLPRSESLASWKMRGASGANAETGLKNLHTRLMLHPASLKRLSWDLAGAFCVAHDVIILPFQAGFEIDTFTPFMVSVWTTLVYWTVDLPMSFLTGYQAGVTVEMRPARVAVKYMKGWFLFDLVLLTTDWTLAIQEAIGTDLSWFARRVRIIRMVRFLRVIRVMPKLEDVVERVQSEKWLIFSHLIKMMLLIIVSNHMIACAWYRIGIYFKTRSVQGGLEGKTWVEAFDIDKRDISYKYSTSLHWSITQFTPASMEIVPVNSYERFFCICVVLFAMIIFSSLVSSITSAMTQLRNLNNQKNAEHSMLRKYLAENVVSADLVSNIWGFLECPQHRHTHRTQEAEVKVLHRIPKSLRSELQHEVFGKILSLHPFFFHFGEINGMGIRKLYECAITEASLLLGEEVFTSGESADRMFFIVNGELHYQMSHAANSNSGLHAAGAQMGATPSAANSVHNLATSHASDAFGRFKRMTTSHVMLPTTPTRNPSFENDMDEHGDQDGEIVRKGWWVVEQILWIESWKHVGKLTAKSSTDIVGLKAKAVQKLLQFQLEDFWQAQKYARLYVDYVNANPHTPLDDVRLVINDILDLAIHAFTPETEGETCTEVKPLALRKFKERTSIMNSTASITSHLALAGSASLNNRITKLRLFGRNSHSRQTSESLSETEKRISARTSKNGRSDSRRVST